MRAKLTTLFASRTRREWEAVFDSVDACVTPVVSLDEFPRTPFSQARAASLTGVDGPEPGYTSQCDERGRARGID